MAYNLNFDEIQKAEREKVAVQKAQRDTDIHTLYDSQKTVTTDEYNRDIEQTKQSYADAYQKNAAQKLINERQIAETNENLGLTDSGLNRTQQTATQLSYANQKGKLDISKQQTLAQKSGALAAALATIEQNRATALADNADYWSSVADSNAQAIYKTNYDAYTAEQKAIIEANTKLQEAAIKAAAEAKPTNVINTLNATLGNLQGSFKDNNISYLENPNDNTITYTDGVTGNTLTVAKGVNPFTGDYNLSETSNSLTARSAVEYDTFKNGYQPKGIVGYGELSVAYKNSDGSNLTYNINGRDNTIWKATKSGKTYYFIWDGNNNEYVEMSNAQFNLAKQQYFRTTRNYAK